MSENNSEPYSVEEIANYFIERGLTENISVNPMKLQKLLYYAYGWYFGYFHRKLFNESIQAWRFGPVVECVYHEVKQHGNYNINTPISKFFLNDMSTFGFRYHTPKFTPKNSSDNDFLNSIWTAYSGYNQFQLSDSTHQEGTPWDIIDKENNHNIPKGVIIPDALIDKYFSSLITAQPNTAN